MVEVVTWVPNNGRNFGDELGNFVLERMVGACTTRVQNCAPPSGNKRFSGVGSHVEFLSGGDVVWTSGVRQPPPDAGRLAALAKKLDVRAVRGKLSAKLLAFDGPLGDGALLLPLFHPARRPATVVPGAVFLPHASQVDVWKVWPDFAWSAFSAVCSPLQPWHLTLELLLRSEWVVTSSLHGVVVCEAYGVPYWWLGAPALPEGRFKFEDFYSAFLEPDRWPVPQTDLAFCAGTRPTRVPSFDFRPLVSRLVQAFPLDLFPDRVPPTLPFRPPAGRPAVTTSCDTWYRLKWRECYTSHARYCFKYGYLWRPRVLGPSVAHLSTIDLMWRKFEDMIEVAEGLPAETELLMFVDCDAMILDGARPMEDEVFAGAPEGAVVAAAMGRSERPNSGVMFFRVGPGHRRRTIDTLRRLLRVRFDDFALGPQPKPENLGGLLADNGALIHLWRLRPAEVHILPLDWNNTHDVSPGRTRDCVHHFTGPMRAAFPSHVRRQPLVVGGYRRFEDLLAATFHGLLDGYSVYLDCELSAGLRALVEALFHGSPVAVGPPPVPAKEAPRTVAEAPQGVPCYHLFGTSQFAKRLRGFAEGKRRVVAPELPKEGASAEVARRLSGAVAFLDLAALGEQEFVRELGLGTFLVAPEPSVWALNLCVPQVQIDWADADRAAAQLRALKEVSFDAYKEMCFATLTSAVSDQLRDGDLREDAFVSAAARWLS